ncbi:MAG: hypothetical protein HZA36_01890 [Parcubacteria group bacterium]|nr:hypothetical protein [Parcubacteria group bacterium]
MLDKNKAQQNEKEMRESFNKKARDMIGQEERFRKTEGTQLVGIESEVAIDAPHAKMEELEGIRDALIGEIGDGADKELGASQVELRNPGPFDILSSNGFSDLRKEYACMLATLIKAAHMRGYSVLRVGANPFLPIKDTPRTSKPKYVQVPNFYNTHRGKHVDTLIGLGATQIDIGFAEVVSLFQSFQVNIEARSFVDAINQMNRSFVIAPYLLALSGNARFLNCADTHLNDMRMVAWEKSHDTRLQDIRVLSWERAFDIRTPHEIGAGNMLRIGLPERYFVDTEDYLARAGQFPYILHNPEAALQIAIGMTWLDARVKFINDSCVVELRLLPTQPTINEEMLLTLIYIGRLVDAQIRNEPLLPIEYVRENRLSAMMYGVHRPMWFISNSGVPEKIPCDIGIKREIQNARYGLRRMGIEHLLDTRALASMMRHGSPSDRLGELLKKDSECVSMERMREVLWEAGMLI